MHHILFVHLSVKELLFCFHILAIINNTAMNVDVPISLDDPPFNSFGYKPREDLLDHICLYV